MDFQKIDNQEYWKGENCLNNIDVDIRCTSSYRTVLHFAIENQASFEIISKLIDMGVNLFAKDSNGVTAQHLGAKLFKNVEMLELLFEYKQHFKVKDDKGNTPFHYSVKYNDSLEIYNYFNSQNVVKLDEINYSNETILHTSLYNRNNANKSKLMLQYDNGKNLYGILNKNPDGMYAVHIAAKYNEDSSLIAELVTISIKCGLEQPYNIQDNNGFTMLMLAAKYNKNCFVTNQILRLKNINTRIKDNEGKTALDHAKTNKDLLDTGVFFLLRDNT